MKPIIGIITRPEISNEKNNIMCIYDDIRQSIINSGGIPVGIIPLNNNLDDFDQEVCRLIDRCDGIIFQGGDSFYKYEIECMKYVHERNIPTLGICLGMQLMGYVFGGKLINIDSNIHKKKNEKYVHEIFIKENSKLYSIFNTDKIKVNSRHKESIINTDLEITAISTDGLIEALEDKNKKFFVGVQWHPESMTSYDILESRLFDYFVNICRK